jgi:hypothetical protein
MTDESASEPQSNGPKRDTRFKKGHPGYKPRGRHRATEIAEKLSKGDLDEIVKALADAAKGGCVQSAAILLNRAWPVPRGRLLRFQMPTLRNMADVAGALDGLLKAVADGQITIPECNELAVVISKLGGVIEAHDFEKRLAAIEATQPRQIGRA